MSMPTKSSTDKAFLTLRSAERRTYCNGAVYVNSAESQVEIEVKTRSKTWSTTPGYHALVKSKTPLPDRAFSFEEQTFSDDLVTYTSSETTPCGGPWDTHIQESSYQMTYANMASTKSQPGEKKLADSEAISKLLAAAKGAEFSLPVCLGEMRETVNMVLRTAQTLATSYRHLRKGRIVEAFRTVKMSDPNPRVVKSFNRAYGNDARAAAANHWLQMQYGWKPLLNDVKNAAEQLAEINEDRKVGRVTSRSTLTTRNIGSYGTEVSPVGTAHRHQVQHESIRYVWRFSPTELNTLGSLGLLNPLSVAWELVPLSFVVDWMLPIGRYLEHLDVPLRFNHVGGTRGYRRSVSTYFSQFVRGGAQGSGSYATTFLTVQRDPLTSIPSLGLDSIRFEPKLGVQRMLSGLALASQAFRR